MIRSISFLIERNERMHVTSSNGKFTIYRKKRSKSFNDRKTFTASDLVNYVKDRDPYITLESGEKHRVYRGGDPTDEVIQTICIVESHDDKFKEEDTLNFDDYYDW